MQQSWESSVHYPACTERARHLSESEPDGLVLIPDQDRASIAPSDSSHRSTQSNSVQLPTPTASRKAWVLDQAVPSTMTLEVAPYVIPEQQITLFKFYMEQAIQTGMTYGNDLYRLAGEFRIEDRSDAYRFGYALIAHGVPPLISVSKQRYRVWISLRNSTS